MLSNNIRFSSLEKEMAATDFNILAWRISWTEEPGGLQSTGLHRIRHDWSNLACTHILNTYLLRDQSILQFLSFLFSSLPSSPLSFCFFLSPFLKKKKKKDFHIYCYGFISENLLRNLTICYLYKLNTTSDVEIFPIHRHCKIWWGNSLAV